MTNSQEWAQALFDDVRRAVEEDLRHQPSNVEEDASARARIAGLEMGLIAARIHELFEQPDAAQVFWWTWKHVPKGWPPLFDGLRGMLAISVVMEGRGFDSVVWQKVTESPERDLFSLAFGLTHMGLVASGDTSKSSLVNHPMIQALYSEPEPSLDLDLPSAVEMAARSAELVWTGPPAEEGALLHEACIGYLAVILDTHDKAREAMKFAGLFNDPFAKEALSLTTAFAMLSFIECFQGQPALDRDCEYLREKLSLTMTFDPSFAARMSQGKPAVRG